MSGSSCGRTTASCSAEVRAGASPPHRWRLSPMCAHRWSVQNRGMVYEVSAGSPRVDLSAGARHGAQDRWRAERHQDADGSAAAAAHVLCTDRGRDRARASSRRQWAALAAGPSLTADDPRRPASTGGERGRPALLLLRGYTQRTARRARAVPTECTVDASRHLEHSRGWRTTAPCCGESADEGVASTAPLPRGGAGRSHAARFRTRGVARWRS